MQRQMMKSKLHRATVTAADLDYIGSVSIDSRLMELADLLPNEQVHIWDVTNGARVVTYAIEAPAGSGEIQINGAAAHHVAVGDLVIICSYGSYDGKELESFAPRVVHLDAANAVTAVNAEPGVLVA